MKRITAVLPIVKKFGLPCILLLGAVSAACLGLQKFQQAQTVSAEPAAPCVILDAGHGGEDGGASSASGVPESGINLDIVLRLEQLFALFGQETILVRDGDYAIYDDGCDTLSAKKVSDLKNRAALVNKTPGAWLVSIHQNFFSQSQYDGAQVFYGAAEGSQALAEAMQARFSSALCSGENRSAKAVDGGVYLMNHISCPAVLVECGFLSNAAESEKLQTSAYQKQIAAVVAGSVLEQLTAQKENSSEV